MNVDKIVFALNSSLRKEILKILAGQPSTASSVTASLKAKGLAITYRETVYRALEKLVESGLVEKYYEKGAGIYYRLSLTHIVIDITKESISLSK